MAVRIFTSKKNNLKGIDQDLLKKNIRKVTMGEAESITYEEGMDEETVQLLNEMIISIKEKTSPMIATLNDSLEMSTNNSIVSDMLKTVGNQVLSIQDMERSSVELENSISNIANIVNTLTEHVNQVTITTSNSIATMLESIKDVQHSTEEVKNFNGMIQSFKAKTSKINEIIDLVKKVANQSSLLALNASIEAARAGTAGRGFAIVADQVKELSGSTAASAEDISRYVKELQQDIDGLVHTVNETTTNLETSNQAINHVATDIQEINGNTETINLRIKDIYAYVQEQTATLNFFMESIHTLSEACNQTQENCNNTGTFIFNVLRQCDLVRGKLFKNISHLTMKEKLRVFAVDHMIFSWQIMNHIDGYQSMDLNKVSKYDTCRFGVFAYSDESIELKSQDAFKQAIEYHNQLHTYAIDAATAAQNKKKDEADRLFSEHKVYLSKFIDALGRVKA